MNRRKARENAFIGMFQMGFGAPLEEVLEISRQEAGEYSMDEYGEALLTLYNVNCTAIDEAVGARLKGWTTGRLPRVSLAILRLAVTEMLYASPDIDSVVINEAVELAKKYGDEGDYGFINGVLGSISREKGQVAPDPET